MGLLSDYLKDLNRLNAADLQPVYVRLSQATLDAVIAEADKVYHIQRLVINHQLLGATILIDESLPLGTLRPTLDFDLLRSTEFPLPQTDVATEPSDKWIREA